jgi:hypothetical protein
MGAEASTGLTALGVTGLVSGDLQGNPEPDAIPFLDGRSIAQWRLALLRFVVLFACLFNNV